MAVPKTINNGQAPKAITTIVSINMIRIVEVYQNVMNKATNYLNE